MTSSDLPGDFEQYLDARGFMLVERSSGGPMGSAKSLFTDGVVDISVFNDRGQRGVGVGVHGGETYEMSVWSRVLGARPPASLNINDQIAWLVAHLEDARSEIGRDPRTGERLREVNWVFIKERLGLSFNADKDDPTTWRKN